MILYRPIGLKELELIAEAHFKAFPPRLSHQPIFYPVLNFEYARQIAEEWNTKDEVSGYVGFVTQFEVDSAYVQKFEVQTVGHKTHEELWIPAEELTEFNQHIVGKIEVVASYCGQHFAGEIDTKTNLPVHWGKGKD